MLKGAKAKKETVIGMNEDKAFTTVSLGLLAIDNILAIGREQAYEVFIILNQRRRRAPRTVGALGCNLCVYKQNHGLGDEIIWIDEINYKASTPKLR